MKIKESEEKMKNSFKHVQDGMVGKLPTGEIVEIIGDGTHKTPDVPKNRTIANENVKKKVRTPAPSSQKSKYEVGIGYSGFTSMITLASIIVIAGIIIAYIIFKV